MKKLLSLPREAGEKGDDSLLQLAVAYLMCSENRDKVSQQSTQTESDMLLLST